MTNFLSGFLVSAVNAKPRNVNTSQPKQTIAIEVNHQWCQRLPLRENVLICIVCEQTKPIRAPLDGIMPCAEVKAWQTPGATVDGDYLIVRGRNP